MNKSLRITLIVVVILIGAAALVWTGSAWGMFGFYPGGMMGFYNQGDNDAQYGYGGMMGSFGRLSNVDPLPLDETREAVESYLASFGNNDLAIEEIMIFDNNAYAIIVEENTGIGAFELLVDPVTKVAYPEYGPNRMWNLKYGMHAGNSFGGHGKMSGFAGGRGGMMGGFGYRYQWDAPDVSAEMPISVEETEQIAQDYLDTYSPGVQVSHEITAFYGYYTIDTEQNGEIVGMLSVNGYSGQVFPHTWHGDFIEMSEE